MSKRNRGFTNKKYEKWLSEGRGSGAGKDYKPWLKIQDIASRGRASRIHGIKTNRQHDFLSDNETNYFYILEFSNSIIDIREQYPLLPIQETLVIADELGIKHHTDPTTGESVVITTDFLIIDKDGKEYARTIKPSNDLDKRQLEKFEIERRYWRKKDIDWGIVTEKEINKVLSRNISIVHPYYDINGIESLTGLAVNDVIRLIDNYKKLIHGEDVIVREISSFFEEKFTLPVGAGIDIYKHLIINKYIKIDITKKIDLDNPQKIVLINNISQEGTQII